VEETMTTQSTNGPSSGLHIMKTTGWVVAAGGALFLFAPGLQVFAVLAVLGGAAFALAARSEEKRQH
jgi:hypothetical protein